MDFILSLTHFCEVHGPTSIICSQVLPFSCSHCSFDLADGSTDGSEATSHDSLPGALPTTDILSAPKSEKRNEKPSPKIEDHPYFYTCQPTNADTEKPLRRRSLTTDGGTCASCSMSLPDNVSKQLPPGAPGTVTSDGKGQNGSPVLRSRELVHSCGSNHYEIDDSLHESHAHASVSNSLPSSAASDSSCHTHLLTYLSLRGPPNPTDYALLRRSSIRTLSCELLPRGLSSGPLCFGDSSAGYTVAYIFRLPDPMARGKRRSYALVALAGKDARRAFRACPVIWRAFGRIATGIVSGAERFQEEEKRRKEQSEGSNKNKNQHYIPVSSFLTGRMADPDGQPRRAGQVRARNLAEIVGNEYIFAELHANFVALLQQLGSMFGGVPISEERISNSTVLEERHNKDPQQPVRVEVATTERQSGHTDDSDAKIASLDIFSRPKPIPISTRRPLVT